MYLLRIALLLIYSQVFAGGRLSLTAYHAVDGQTGSLDIQIDTIYTYPPFNITVVGPNQYKWSQDSSMAFKYVLPDLQPGIYQVIVVNRACCVADQSIEILACYSSSIVPKLVLCQQALTSSHSKGIFFLASSTTGNAADTLNHPEFTVIGELPTDVLVQKEILSKGIKIRQDIHSNGRSLFSIPEQGDIMDESYKLLIKFNAAGEILWVYQQL